ncbi:KH domain-containing protein [Drosera capensis]
MLEGMIFTPSLSSMGQCWDYGLYALLMSGFFDRYLNSKAYCVLIEVECGGIMEGERNSFLKKRQFKKKGSSKKGRGHGGGARELDRSFGDLGPADTVYRILCPSKKIGGVIGRGGSIVNALRDETHAKITVGESIPGSEDRVIMIFSPPTRVSKKESDDNEENERMRPHCAAQDALMRVHSRITEEDFFGGVDEDEQDDSEVIAHLLVPNDLVGCILGKGGDVIQKLRSETGANIRVLPKDHAPICVMSSDELVQISGKPDRVKLALFDVSTRLHQNPRKDNFMSAPGGFHHHAPPMSNRPLLGDHMPPGPWMVGFRNPSPRSVPFGYLDSPMRHGGDPSVRAGDSNVQVEEATPDSEERVICVSAFETLVNPWSQTIDAILQLQHKTSDFSDEGIVTTRILAPSSKIGCIIGEGGSIINEMRWRTKADICVHPKEDKPPNASKDEELVHVSRSFPVVKDALVEIASRLRTRILRNANAGEEPGLEPPVPGYAHPAGYPGRGPSFPGPLERVSLGYNAFRARTDSLPLFLFKGGADDLEPSYPIQPNPSRCLSAGSPVEINYPNGAVAPNYARGSYGPGSYAPGGSNIKDATEAAAVTRSKPQDPPATGRYDVSVGALTPADHPNTAQNIAHTYMAPGTHSIPHPGPYPDPYSQYSAYHGMMAQQQQEGAYHSSMPQQRPQGAHHSNTAQQRPQGAYHSTTAQQRLQGAYHSTTAQQRLQGAYLSTTAQQPLQGVYHSTTVQQQQHGAYHGTMAP